MEEILLLLLPREGNYEDAADVIVHALLFDTVQPERPIIPDLRFCLWEHSNADSELLFRFDLPQAALRHDQGLRPLDRAD
ncbi:hypothetical protein PF003_g1711 [Phytophthora fragariae]|nr:hypothetical protein PF003_g1711 [Phytophthora fragariae]